MTPEIACIGAGNWGRNLVRNFHALNALRAICDPSPVIREAMSLQYPGVSITASVADVLNDERVTAVVIATPAETHGALVKSALERGKDVFVEKPLCLSVQEGQELVRLAEQKGRILMVGHLLWYHPAVLKLKELINAGDLGRIQYIYSNRLNLGRIRREENALWSFAPHDISVILGLLEESPVDVQARGGNYLHPNIADVTVSLLSFSSGVQAHVFVSWLHPFKEQKLIVVGERKMAVFDDVERDRKLVLYPHSIEWKNHAPIPSKANGIVIDVPDIEPLHNECEHFLQCVQKRERPRTDGIEALRVLEVLKQCQQALDAVRPGPTNGEAKSAAPNFPTDIHIHESAYIDEGVQIGRETTIWHFSHVLKGSKIGSECRIGQNVVIGPRVTVGNGVKIQNNVSVYEGVTLEDHVFCGPSMVFTNVYNPRSEIRRMDELRQTLVKRGASLGANCTIVCGITIGRYAFIGAGSVVHRDVPDYALVVGNPGRIVGWMCECGSRIEFVGGTGTCKACKSEYSRLKDTVTPIQQKQAVLVQ